MPTPTPTPVSNARQAPDLWEVIAPGCAAASVGVLSGILGALRQINPDLRFQFDVLSLPDSRRRDMLQGAALALGVLSAVGWMVWRLARLFGQPDDPGAVGDVARRTGGVDVE